MRTANGIDWSPIESSTNETLNCIKSTKNGIVASGQNGTVIFSENGENWQTTHTGKEFWEEYFDIISFEDTTMIVGSNGMYLLSTDCRNWTRATAYE